MKLLLDGDIVAYQITAACEQEFEWADDRWTLNCDIADCQDRLRVFQEGLLSKFPESEIHYTFSDKNNFRKDVYPAYKGSRKTRKPIAYKPFVDWIKHRYPHYELPKLEADDVMGIMSTEQPGEWIIVTIDKDLNQIPGKVYNWSTQTLHDISIEEADNFFYVQCLTGDITDNYPGLKGTGPVGAIKLLDAKGYSWKSVVECYEKAGQTEEDALIQARCARILRNTDWDKDKQEVVLWTGVSLA